MPSNDAMSAKKKELLAYKAKILQEIKYCDNRIEEVRSKCLKNSFVQDSDSSESEEEFSLSIDNGPSVSQLKQQQAMLCTCLQATQELTSLQVLQSEVNLLVEDPEIIGEPPVKEPGVWREVTAECRVDLVPFSITFFVHQPDRQFGQLSYRGLRVVPVKSAHEGELKKSVLPSVGRPSDAVEVVKSYAAAQRSRRTSLARLADKYANELYMEPMPDGGYILKCANLLEVSWTLQNKWSPIAPFHHRMKFDIEYMDESYIKIITQAHRQLSDPSLETDERTLLLSKIISTCLEAQGPTQELYESMSSDPENTHTLKTRRTTLDEEPDGPGMKKKKEKELMAPPKSLPKKTKVKGKENVADNQKDKLKRGNSDENIDSAKKMRTELEEERIFSENGAKSSEKTKSVAKYKVKKGNIDKNINNVEEGDQILSENGVKSTEKPKSIAKEKLKKGNSDENMKSGKETRMQVEEEQIVSENGIKSNEKVKSTTKEKLKRGNSDSNINKVKKMRPESAEEQIISASVSKSNEKAKSVAPVENNKQIERAKHVDKASVTSNEAINPQSKKVVEVSKVVKETNEINKVVKDKTVKDKIDKGKEITQPKDLQKTVKNNKNVDKTKPTKEKDTKAVESVKSNDKTKTIKDIGGGDTQKTVNTKKITKTVESDQNGDKNKEISHAEKNKKVAKVATTQNKPDSAKTTDGNTKNLKGNASDEKKDKVNKVATVKNKQPAKEVKEANKPENKVGNKKDVVSATNKDPTKIKAPITKTSANADNIKKVIVNKNKPNAENKTNVINKDQKLPNGKITNKTTATKTAQNELNADTNKAKNTNENTVEKVIEKNVAVKTKNNLVNKDNVTNAKKISKPQTAANSTEKIKKTVTENRIQKITNKLTPKMYEKFKSRLIPGGVKTGNTKILNSTDSQNSDKKSKIPQKKLSAISESMLKKNPLRISPRKISSKFKTPLDSNQIVQKTTSIPRLMKKPLRKT